MKLFKSLKTNWAKFFSVFLFILLLGAYADIFAIGAPYAPGATLNPACPPGEVNCTVDITSYPAGLDTEIQFNNAGLFGSSSDFTYDHDNLFNAVIGAPTGDQMSLELSQTDFNLINKVFGVGDVNLLNISSTGNLILADTNTSNVQTNSSGSYSMTFGGTDSGNGSYIQNNASRSLTFGEANTGGHILNEADDAFVFGRAEGTNSYIHGGGVGASYGYAGSGGYINNDADGGTAYGYAEGSNSYIYNGGNGGLSHGYVSGNNSYIDNGSAGGVARGYAGTGGYIYNGSDGGTASGIVNGVGSYISNSGAGGTALGIANGGGNIKTNADAGFAYGNVDNGFISVNSSGSTAFGSAYSGAQITTENEGSLAFGRMDGAAMIRARGEGSFAGGSTDDIGLIEASDEGAFAFGNINNGSILASSAGSMARGYSDNSYTIEASGRGSTAFGSANGGNITASSWGSFAFGSANSGNIEANNSGAFAGGLADSTDGIKANGSGSFAFGSGIEANSYLDFAVGRYNVGNVAHDSEWITTDPLFEIGNGTSAVHNNALTVLKNGNIGINTATPRTELELSGDGAILATGTYGNGWTEPNLGAGTRMIWYPKKAAFRAGSVTGTQWNDASIGIYSTAIGFNTTASGAYSTALGYSTTANGLRSFAMGNGTTASGQDSTAMGTNSTASGNYSFSIGTANLASGSRSTAIGGNTIANGDYSTAMGNTTTATSYASVAIGRYNVAAGTAGSWVATDSLFEIGNGTSSVHANALTVLKNGAVGIGTATPRTKLELSGDGAILATGTFNSGWTEPSLGSGTRMMWYPKKAAFRAGSVSGTQWNDASIGSYSTAMGDSTTASGLASTATGTGTIASGQNSFTLGNSTTASGDSSMAMGLSTIASGDYSNTTGIVTSASGWGSTSMGYGSVASGDISVAMGEFTQAQSSHSVAIGRYNVGGGTDDSWVAADPLFEIGNGSAGLPSNALTVLKNGNTGIGITTPNSKLHLAAGSTSVAPLGFTSGPLLSTTVAGKVEFLTDAYYGTITTGAGTAVARKTFAFLESPIFTGTVTTPAITITTGANNGYVLTSDGSGNATWQASAAGGTTYIGAWDATANSPALADGVGTLGDIYSVSVGGVQFTRTFVAGGWAIYNGSIWEPVGTSTAVTSVNSQTGVVQLNPSLAGNILSISGGTLTADLTSVVVANASTVTTNANLTGAITSIGNATSLGSFTSTNLFSALSDNVLNFGSGTTASGTLSFTMGSNTTASAANTVAMGLNTVASGQDAFAMGSNTSATGDHSVAFGYSTIAQNESSVAMGDNTAATGDFSVALGSNTQAQSESSFAMGTNTIASYDHAVTFGYNTLASGDSALAFGNASVAGNIYSSGIGSLAFGYSQGGQIYADTDGALAFGRVNNNGRITADNYGALVHGYAEDGAYLETGEIATVSGYASGADGVNESRIQAGGTGSLVNGYAVSGGYINTDGSGSFATGWASGADGAGNVSYVKTGSDGASVSGVANLGGYINASGWGSTASGVAQSSGTYIDSSGNGSQAFGYADSGYYINSGADGSFAFGYATTGNISATGDGGSFAFGRTEDGNDILSSGVGSFAGGNTYNYDITSSGNGSFAFGYTGGLTPLTASGNGSVAMGIANTASGIGSVALGEYAIASGEGSFATGYGTKAESFLDFVTGQWNVGGAAQATEWVATDPLFEIGNGNGNLARSNALTIYKDGRFGFNGLVDDGGSPLSYEKFQQGVSGDFSFATMNDFGSGLSANNVFSIDQDSTTNFYGLVNDIAGNVNQYSKFYQGSWGDLYFQSMNDFGNGLGENQTLAVNQDGAFYTYGIVNDGSNNTWQYEKFYQGAWGDFAFQTVNDFGNGLSSNYTFNGSQMGEFYFYGIKDDGGGGVSQNTTLYLGNNGYFELQGNGDFGVGNMYQGDTLVVSNTGQLQLYGFQDDGIGGNSQNSTLEITEYGNVNFYGIQVAGGIITQNPTLQITSAGAVSIANLTSCGGIQTNGSGTMSCTSDERLKDIQSEFTAGLDAIMQINPQTYSWKSNSGLYDGGVNYSGFIAQNIASAIPEASNTNSAGYLQINTTTILATTINAIKDMNLKVEEINNFEIDESGNEIVNTWRDSITAWFANATNRITRIFTGEVCLTEVGEDPVCLNRAELQSLKTLLNGTPTQPATTPVVTEPTVTDPVVTDPIVTDPIVSDPVVTEPVVTEPVVTEPVVEEPAVTDPVVEEPVVTEPVVTDPVVEEPVTP